MIKLNMKVFIADVKTESCDHYHWVFSSKPSRDQVIELLMETEGADVDDRDFYTDTTSVKILEKDVIELTVS